jgi:hypothetical protein
MKYGGEGFWIPELKEKLLACETLEQFNALAADIPFSKYDMYVANKLKEFMKGMIHSDILIPDLDQK